MENEVLKAIKERRSIRQQRYDVWQKGWSGLPAPQHRLSSQDPDAGFDSHRTSSQPVYG